MRLRVNTSLCHQVHDYWEDHGRSGQTQACGPETRGAVRGRLWQESAVTYPNIHSPGGSGALPLAARTLWLTLSLRRRGTRRDMTRRVEARGGLTKQRGDAFVAMTNTEMACSPCAKTLRPESAKLCNFLSNSCWSRHQLRARSVLAIWRHRVASAHRPPSAMAHSRRAPHAGSTHGSLSKARRPLREGFFFQQSEIHCTGTQHRSTRCSTLPRPAPPPPPDPVAVTARHPLRVSRQQHKLAASHD